MPTSLTTPIVKNAVTATVDQWDLIVTRNTDLSVDLNQTQLSATMNTRFADGTISQRTVWSKNYAELPIAAQNAVKSFHASVISYLRTQGVLPAGTDTTDI